MGVSVLHNRGEGGTETDIWPIIWGTVIVKVVKQKLAKLCSSEHLIPPYMHINIDITSTFNSSQQAWIVD